MKRCAVYNILFVYDKELKWSIQGYFFVLFTCQPTKSSNLSRSGVNVRAHQLHKNYSRNFSSIRSAPQSIKAHINGARGGFSS